MSLMCLLAEDGKRRTMVFVGAQDLPISDFALPQSKRCFGLEETSGNQESMEMKYIYHNQGMSRAKIRARSWSQDRLQTTTNLIYSY